MIFMLASVKNAPCPIWTRGISFLVRIDFIPISCYNFDIEKRGAVAHGIPQVGQAVKGRQAQFFQIGRQLDVWTQGLIL